MKFPSSILIAVSITVFIFVAAGIAKVSSSNEIALSEEFNSKSGDWVVNTTEGNSSETIYLERNLTIEANGKLTLDNVTLIFNCTSDGEYHIEIKDGGELHICNNSTITVNEPKYHYLFWVRWVREGAKLTMENSNLRYCGYKGASPSDYGLYICSSNVLIRNCTLEKNNWGIYYVPNTCQTERARIENNIITNNSHGISVYGGINYCADPYIANNTISFSDSHGIYCTHDYSEIINNTISYNDGNGIFCDYLSNAKIENNSLLSNGKNGVEVAAGSRIEKITGNKIENNNYGIYCYSGAATTSISNLSENTMLNGSVGIYCAASSVDNICNNTIKNLSSCGIHIIRAQSECNISWNNITECGIGIYCDDTDFPPENKTITYNNISSTHSGLYCRYSSPQVIAGNKFSNNQLAINFSGASADVDYLNNTFENNIEGVLLQEWHLKVSVRVDGESVKEGAQVTVKNKLGEIVLNETTCSAGYMEGWITEYKTLNNYSKESYTPHTIIGYKQYVGNATKIVSITDNGEEALDLTIPELYPEKIVVSGFPSEGQNLTVSVVVVNNGTAAAENVIVRFLCDNLPIANQSISFIAAGRNETANITCPTVKGAHLFEVQVNPDNLIEERGNAILDNNITQWVSINAKPVAAINVVLSDVATYVNVTFYAVASYDPDAGGVGGNLTAYWFEFGDGTNSGWITANRAEHNYTHKDVYNATVKVKDNFGVGAESDWSSIVQVTVQNRPPVANISASKNGAYTHEEIIFYATGSYDAEEPYELLYGEAGHRIIKYYWDFGDGSSSVTTDSIVSHSYTDNGNYTVSLIVQDDDLDNSTVKTFSVRILNRAPTASFIIMPGVASVNDKLQFNASFAEDLDGEIKNYILDFGDGSKGYSAVCEHSYTQAGLYMVVLTVFDDDGANNTYVLVVDIKPLPTWIELHYKEVYIVGAIFCILGAIFFSLRWYEEAKRKEKEVKLWAEKKGAEKEIKIEEEVEEWAEKKKKLKTIDERIKEWAKRRAAEKKAKEEKVEKGLDEWAAKKEAKKKK